MATRNRNAPAYRNPERPVGERVESLLRIMTLDEKIAQLGCVLGTVQLTEETKRKGMAGGIGQVVLMGDLVLQDPERIARTIAEIQRFLVEETRLGIPAIVHVEALAGAMFAGATNFPIPLAVAATWDPEALQALSGFIRHQMLAVGFRQALSPVMDIARDPRWGRVGETFGEDPLLVSRMSVAYVEGLQTADLAQGALATGKHFLGYGSSEGALNTATQHLNDRELREVYARPFEAAIREAGLASVMNSYGEIDGLPIGASAPILTDLLRGELGFEGFTVSDYMSIDRLVDPSRIAQDITQAGVLALRAGIDVELPVVNAYGSPLREAVKEGRVPMERIDEAVRRVLAAKFRLGLFERPEPPDAAEGFGASAEEARALSRRLATKSAVLLKNEGGLLPLSPDIGRIAVIGPNADSIRNLFGGYTFAAMLDMGMHMAKDGQSMMGVSNEAFHQDHETDLEIDNALRARIPGVQTLLEAIRGRVSDRTEVVHEEGCPVKGGSADGIARAVEAAAGAACAILVLGGKHGWGVTSTSGEGIDATRLGLPGLQDELLRRVRATGTPIVLVHLDGRPLSCARAVSHAQAVLEAWAPGQEGAGAIADLLFGRAVPSGKLPVTLARSAGQIPVYYNHHNGSGYSTTNRLILEGYIDETARPLFCFGHGLSYASFEYSDLLLPRRKVDASGSVEVAFRVRNCSDRAADEIVQLYFRDPLASLVRPVKELVGFRRVPLAAGAAAEVRFTVDLRQLAFLDAGMRLVVEPGTIEVEVGASSEDIRLKDQFEIAGERRMIDRRTVFFPVCSVSPLDSAPPKEG